MSTVVRKVKRLEEYIASTNASAKDRVLELIIDKLLDRETSRLISQKTRLEQQLAGFERKYRLSSKEFYEKFERGELGDTMDFVEWSATREMVANLRRQLSILVPNAMTILSTIEERVLGKALTKENPENGGIL